MVRGRERDFDRAVWPEFNRLRTELELYLEETVDHLVTTAMRSDGDNCDLQATRMPR